MTLILISTTSPKTFSDVMRFTRDVVPFALSIILIGMIWNEHYVFFLRYGLRGTRVIVLNLLLLFIVLFYVYPLKFLTTMLLLPVFYGITGNQEFLMELQGMIKGSDVSYLMMIYGFGAASIFLVMQAMYRYAYKHREALELNEIEKFDTQTSIRGNMLLASIPLLSALIALFMIDYKWAGVYSGFIYFLYTPVMFFFYSRREKNRKRLLAQGHKAIN
ncbi:MAG: DUF1211 domain-containing protein [Flammeovirgaceae bacterium]|nr:DUF1211 domain-containing protein [Flammeovirgaceae bacterium]